MPRRAVLALALALALLPLTVPPLAAQAGEELARQVEIRRTTHGVPHILAENIRAAGFGLGYVQVEDYGERVIRGLINARGARGLTFGPDSMGPDFLNRLAHARAVETYHLLSQDTRDMLEGFAEGVNHYIRKNPDRVPEWAAPIFTGHDVAARDISVGATGAASRFLRRLRGDVPATAAEEGEGAEACGEWAYCVGEDAIEEGSNAWAFAPSRTRSGRAILLRNPHLAWTAGYYEAHITVPGELNFYGDFRIGGPFTIIGGFNEHLGWATTNNDPDTDEIYALDADPSRPDHYLFDGASIPLRRVEVTVEFRNGPGIGTETRTFWTTPLGPVLHRDGGKIYVLRAAGDGEYRVGEQFMRMMKARNLEEWKDAMRLRARTTSNFTYADREGNIFYIWNAALPKFPHPSGGDTAAVPARRSSEVWTALFPFDSLPQFLNPTGGYIHNENDAPYYANMHRPLDPVSFPPYFPEPRLRLRSQHAVELIHNRRKLRLEDVVALKHSMKMLLADRVKSDLVAAVRATDPTGEVAAALELIERWDNTVAPESRGGVLFETWWRRYVWLVEARPREQRAGGSPGMPDGPEREALLFREPWTPERPLETPRGLADLQRAAEAFAWAVEETRRQHGSWDVAWGDVHRVRRGAVDVPVGGCSGALGCFRVLNFREDEDGKRVVVGGDGWVLAVEFTDPPRAYSVLGYGQSPDPASPYHADQAAMFAAGRMKKVAFTEQQIREQLVERYRPGEERRRE
jgi:acyl-homoserine-lactone acylase